MTENAGYQPRKYEGQRYAETQDIGTMITGHNQAAIDYSRDQGLHLEQGQQFRAGLNGSDHDYRSLPHDRLQHLVNDGVNPGGIDEQGTIANNIGNTQLQLASAFRQAAAKEETEWQGKGAAGAHAFFGKLASWAESSGNATHLTSNRLSQQAGAVTNAKNNMPEPAGRSVDESMKEVARNISSGDFDAARASMEAMQAEARRQQEAHAQAAEVLAQRDRELFRTGSTQPMFAPPPQLGQDSTSAAGFTGGNTGSPVGSSGGAPPVGPGGPGSPMSGPAGPHTGAGSVPPPGAPGGPAPNVGRTPGPGLSPAAFGGTTVPGGQGLGRYGSETVRNSPNRSGFPGRAGSFVSGKAGGPGGTGTGAGGPRGGAPGSATGGPGNQPGAGKGTGAGVPGGRSAGEVLRGGAAAAGSRATGVPGGMAGAGQGQQREEDKEHKRADYLQENDPNEYFGTQGLDQTTPAVIGEIKPPKQN
ncbi:hypothetical protein [Amycolatopsis suaedae]|uniref:PPE domain-containing protein n=1 Tax=Amycolatopsis suaedae TaxID=2510978 RepID=A0A4Q7J078_9PSEU|nr:hypothetical protein [Amycolatopsis suaedae]RZQ60740.1 hypothetical protein EWH70_26885 [Amycolatopsis suaedae]